MNRPHLGICGILALALVCFLAWPRSAEAAKPDASTQALKEAEEAFRLQDYERVIELLSPMATGSDTLPAARRIQILERKGVSHWYQEQGDAARLSFARLLKGSPEHTLDTTFYPRELIDFFENEKARLKALGFLSPPSVTPTSAPTVSSPAPPTHTMPTIGYLMPFGVGQFANNDTTLGAVLATCQFLGVAATVGAYWGADSLRSPTTGKVGPEDRTIAELLQGVWIAGVALAGAAYIYSITDGLLNRPIDPSLDAASSDSVGLENHAEGSPLLFAPSASGIGLSVSGQF